jgi:hypothetical protein
MPNDCQLDVDKTFENQKNLINNSIVPTVMKALDKNTFPVAETVIYELIHARHKHRREEHLNSQQSEEIKDGQKRRKHLNSRRNDVRDEPVLFGFLLF